MSITLGSNIASLQAQRQLFRTEEKLSTVFERLSSGQRINRASDDAAGLAISESLNTDRRVFNQAIRNLNDGLSVLNIADSTVSELSGIVIRIQELAEQAANGSLSKTQRESLDAEAQELRDEFFRVSRSADFNGLRLFDGSIENGVRLQAGYGEDGSIFSSLGGEMGTGTFQSAETVTVGDWPLAVDHGDFNGDGITDLVTGQYAFGSRDVTVMLGNGDGTFQSPRTFLGGSTVDDVAARDLNGDGVLDLTTANRSDDNVTVLIGNGDGTFAAAQTFAAGNSPNELTFGYFNDDENLDMAVTAEGNNAVSILLGNGDGSFGSYQQFSAGGEPNDLVVGDFNNDGIADIIAANPDTDSASILIGNGDGTFSELIEPFAGEGVQGVASADFNNDGNLDFVTAVDTDSFAVVYLGNGNGTFSGIAVGTPEGGSAVTTADFNGDGLADFSISKNQLGTRQLSVFLGNGDGTFSAEMSFGPLARGRDIDTADVDGDGVLDLFVADGGGISLYRGETREGINPILEFSLTTQADALQALAPLERKLQSLSEQRGTIGAFQSRLQSALNTLSATSENYAAAESRIKDADIAFESSQLTRLNILQQAAAAVLGQANQQPALALQLLQ